MIGCVDKQEDLIDFTLTYPIPCGNLVVRPKDLVISCCCGGKEAKIVGNAKWFMKYCLKCGMQIQYHINLEKVVYYGRK